VKSIPLTGEQQAEVERLVAAGVPRPEAEVLVAETVEDIDDTPLPMPKMGDMR